MLWQTFLVLLKAHTRGRAWATNSFVMWSAVQSSLHVIDLTGGYEGRDPVEDYRIINNELKAYLPELAERPASWLAIR